MTNEPAQHHCFESKPIRIDVEPIVVKNYACKGLWPNCGGNKTNQSIINIKHLLTTLTAAVINEFTAGVFKRVHTNIEVSFSYISIRL